MPRLAVNFSPQAAALLRTGQIEFDLWKCSPPGSVAGTHLAEGTGKSAYIHFPFDAGRSDLLESDWDEVERVLDRTGTPFVNVHLNARRCDFQSGLTSHERTVVRDRFLSALTLLAERFGADRVIAENVIYRGENGPYLRASVEPDLIREVLSESGCRFLFDTAHARISAGNLGIDRVEDYISELPVNKIAEMHVTGVAHDENRLRDSMPMTESDWRLTEWSIRQIQSGHWQAPWAIALEYGGVGPSYEWRSEAVVIANELTRLAEIMNRSTPPNLP